MTALVLGVLSVFLCVLWGEAAVGSPRVYAVVLGIAQDGGVPHIGCRQELCVAARRHPERRRRVASIGLVDERSGRRYLLDATPDLPAQLEILHGGRGWPDRARPVDGIFLTHAHAGHYSGLMYLGREALGARGVPVHATPRLARFLRENGPWGQLVSLGQIDLRELPPGRELALAADLTVTPVAVPHRDEYSDTVGFRVRGPSRSLLFIPDIDKWERWDRRLEDEVAAVDTALLDGTFFDAGEVPGRSLAEIPHPLVEETAVRLQGSRRRVLLIHLNHTNRLLWDGAARRRLQARGLDVAREGQELPL
ncbi:MAG TPA: MBL fold metallo-hydrolase [Vicinamibacteria bacterium]|nr:MBL fold metallo-hydrolase [Vicinamibacteria bacterium]